MGERQDASPVLVSTKKKTTHQVEAKQQSKLMLKETKKKYPLIIGNTFNNIGMLSSKIKENLSFAFIKEEAVWNADL